MRTFSRRNNGTQPQHCNPSFWRKWDLGFLWRSRDLVIAVKYQFKIYLCKGSTLALKCFSFCFETDDWCICIPCKMADFCPKKRSVRYWRCKRHCVHCCDIKSVFHTLPFLWWPFQKLHKHSLIRASFSMGIFRGFHMKGMEVSLWGFHGNAKCISGWMYCLIPISFYSTVGIVYCGRAVFPLEAGPWECLFWGLKIWIAYLASI